MANHLYGSYNPSSYGGAASNLSSVYPDQYSSRYLTGTDSNLSSYSSLTDRTLFGHTDSAYSSAASRLSWPGPPGVDVSGAAAVDPLYAGLKRPPSDALYHQTVLGAHNTLGTEAWYSTNPLAKRPRFESASNLPIYPQRPGEKDCAHYMLTRTCKFGEGCKFDHPIWVPEGGIPDWKEQVPLDVTTEVLPERPGEPDCPYFLKTQRCKFGPRCKFNHPKDNVVPSGAQENVDASALPVRPSEPTCAFYSKTGSCKFGATCKFNHPKDIVIPPAVPENGTGGQNAAVTTETAVKPLFTPASLHNTKGLPIRPGEVDCPFYLKTGSCKYGATCRYNHPDRYAITPSVAFVASPAAHLNMGVVNPAASLLQTIDPRLTQTAFPTIYPQRPGQLECDFYMKTGICKFGETCKYHHPIDRTVHTQAREAAEQNVKLTLAGLPRREGAVHCPYYMKTGTCKYGATCKFDHPPPGEVMATATTTAAVATQGEDAQAVQE